MAGLQFFASAQTLKPQRTMQMEQKRQESQSNSKEKESQHLLEYIGESDSDETIAVKVLDRAAFCMDKVARFFFLEFLLSSCRFGTVQMTKNRTLCLGVQTK